VAALFFTPLNLGIEYTIIPPNLRKRDLTHSAAPSPTSFGTLRALSLSMRRVNPELLD
jgi:hypothetical protein